MNLATGVVLEAFAARRRARRSSVAAGLGWSDAAPSPRRFFRRSLWRGGDAYVLASSHTNDRRAATILARCRAAMSAG